MTSNNIAEQYVNEIIDEVVKKNLFDNKNDNSTIKINELKKKIETLLLYRTEIENHNDLPS